MKNMKNIKNILLLLFVTSFAFTSCSSDDDGPSGPDYSTYFFDNYLTIDDVELVNSNGYSFTVTLSRSTATQADNLNLSLTDASGKFGFVGGMTTSTVSFASNESSKIINIEPLDASDVSIFETYNITVSIVPPSGTPSQTEFSKSVEASVSVNWVSAGDGTIDYGWAFAAPVYGSASSTVSLEKDSNVMLYRGELYASGYDIEFAIVNGDVVIDTDQQMFLTDAGLLGAEYIMIMQVTTAVYDDMANTVTLTYDMANEDPSGVNLPDSYRLGIVDVITLP